ncbi:MAG: LytTR family transcriptional regulator [Tannerellaceae bacterium]|jgi:hypothetical protein|nr:LytTR family transcriptional regulator [Tannerellaceae bacterium]
MPDHPFIESSTSTSLGSLLILSAASIQCVLLALYVQESLTLAVIDSILSVVLLGAVGYLAWYVIFFVKVWSAQIILALVVQGLCLGVCYSILSLSDLITPETFLKSLPLRFFSGLLCWIILLQWYWIKRKEREEKELQEETNTIEEKTDMAPDGPCEIIDRISVRDGGRIHIVHMTELFCIQASGDYVTLFTPTGQYIKEQTMKYLEKSLPATFVRIHRSSIVNTDYIMRVELFGKESYHIRLKNGMSLKASGAGYKLLKEKLNL